MSISVEELPRPNYRMRLISDLSELDAIVWDALLQASSAPTPFLRHAFLHALTATGCASARTGWDAQFLTLWSGKKLVAAMPLYFKSHSYGEYVFDWAWADAYQRHGEDYYPKMLCAVPFTPVSGSRLLAKDETARAALVDTALALLEKSSLSSLHVLYPSDAEAVLLRERGFLMRDGVQFHWTNRDYTSFEDFLTSLERKKRKNIRAERRHVREAGVTFEQIPGQDITGRQWAFFHRCYSQTYREHHSSPYLSLEFFEAIGRSMPENLHLVLASRLGHPIASALVVVTHDTLYGRYWGALESIPCLHFECAYYQPIEHCIASGIRVFEGGAQGEHKMARGFLPVRTQSAHQLSHPAFADAIERFLAQESNGILGYIDELNERNPFRANKPEGEAP